MQLADLITEQMVPDEEAQTLLEIFRSPHRLSPDECLEAMRHYRTSLDSITQSTVLAETTRALLALRGLEEPFHTLYFLYALDYQEEGNKSSLDMLRREADKWIGRMKTAAREKLIEGAVGSTEASIDCLCEVWQEETASLLARITEKKISSAERWLRGGKPRSSSANQIRCFARFVYVLRQEENWPGDEIRLWAEEPLRNGITPIRMMSAYQSNWLMTPAVFETYMYRLVI